MQARQPRVEVEEEEEDKDNLLPSTSALPPVVQSIPKPLIPIVYNLEDRDPKLPTIIG